MRHGAVSNDTASPSFDVLFFFIGDAMRQMFYVYILLLSNRQLYTGYTTDLERRLGEHHRGGVAFTRDRLPVELIHNEAYALETDARRREGFLKTTEGKRLLRKQIRDILTVRNVVDSIVPA